MSDKVRLGWNPLKYTYTVAPTRLLVLIGIGAAYAPARRAVRVDPVIALRAE